jgi:hypothetical protein
MKQQLARLYQVLRGLFGRRGSRAAAIGRPPRQKLDEGLSRAIKEYREVFERLEQYDRS